MFQAKDFEGVCALLNEQDVDELHRSYRALNIRGLSRFGLADYESALGDFESAERTLDRVRAQILVNKSNLLKVMGRYDEALSAAQIARDLAPKWAASHLSVLAVLECRNDGNGRRDVEGAVSEMKRIWPEWRSDRDFWSYLMTDVDYSSLRASDVFGDLFGTPPQLERETQ